MCEHLFPLALQLVLSLILPLLDYSCTTFTDITKEQNPQLQRALNACIRFICQMKWDEHISPYYEELRWLKVHSRHLYFVGNLIFSILHSKRSLILYDGFEFKSNKILRTTKTLNDTLILPIYHTECFKKSFRCSAAELWNYTPTFSMLLVCMFSRAKCMIIYLNQITDLILMSFSCILSYCFITFYFNFYLLFTYKHFSFLYVLLLVC